MCLTARSAEALEETAAALSREGLTVRTLVIDHSKTDVAVYQDIVKSNTDGAHFNLA